MRFKLFALALAVAVFAGSCDKNPDLGPGVPVENIQEADAVMSDDIIPGQYIVVYNQLPGNRPAAWEQGIARAKEVTRGILDEFQVPAGNVGYVYAFAIEGFSATLTSDQVSRLSKDKRVKYIEADQLMRISATQSDATWGLDRIDQRNLPLNQTYTYDATGQGVRAYIIDTGIRHSHNDFGGRASFGFDAFGGNGEDGNGHGTHVAGTVGGNTYGVAKQVLLYSVRVLDNSGSGTTSGVIAGMDWVAANHIKPAVANMSLGGGASTAINDAVGRIFDAGVPVIVAAGNGNLAGRAQNACNYSPAGAPRAYTIGATTTTDAKASYSNYGDCVNLFAPGSGITSAWYTSNTAINTISGTSMASPHVAGAAALFLQNNTGASAQQVYDALTNASTKGIVSSSKTTNNHLLYTLGFGGGTVDPPVNNPPLANFTYTTNELTASFNASGSTDTDGSIVTYAWNFGDGSTGSGVSTSKTYAAAGTYSVMLTVTDNAGATGSKSQSVTVSAPPPSGDDIILAVSVYKVKGRKYADLKWSGATTSQVDIFRDGSHLITVNNSLGTWTHATTELGGGTHTYQVKESGGSKVSNVVTVVY